MLAPTYPGVYIEEVPSGVRTITGVATSITAFIGRARRGPVNQPTRIQSFADYERLFGGLWTESTMSYAVRHFFQHGGAEGLIVRVFHLEPTETPADFTATLDLADEADPTATALTLEAASPGAWGNTLRAVVDHNTSTGAADLFNLTVQELDTPGGTTVLATETFLNVSTDAAHPRFVPNVLAEGSSRVRVAGGTVNARPAEGTFDADGNGSDGSDIEDADIEGSAADREGLFALDAADLFNLLCIPPLSRTADVDPATLATAAGYCRERRAMLLVDPEAGWIDVPTAETGVNDLRTAIGTDNARNAIAYFPRLLMPDPLNENRLTAFAPSGAVAGIIARTDAQRGVWKAPAGLDASFSGVRAFTYRLTDEQNGTLNPLGLNCLRTFPVTGNVVWGARTLAGADRLASEWKYVPVRRLALFIEESLYRGTQWVVFEPNDEPLWAQIRLNVGAFMQNLFRQGAFQGTSPREAYFVKCDRETTTQNDIDLSIVNILVGFAPLKPAEFVIIRIQQIAGQVEA
ncbi:phage tail sheath subtilisin-like domain-containing protein [Rhodocaloribacter litoris]|uniref:phage tail sheath family protein n=1 Tax=Rhodocaloribacter litoris TaxID=2558931 RepID=UPI00141DB260|nr:phage tail sheath C-terminal domain-containing protein [Rhodocaloribacter litoris]QXD15731.1 phage tail sheath subtilisin-like domain-containing protein [Rhodocaloribacter litoris]